MLSQEFSREQIIEFAANTELRGIKLYTEAAKRVEQEVAKNILHHLAEQEKTHEKYFRQLYDDIKNNRKTIPVDIDDEAVGYLSALAEIDVFPADDEAFIDKINNITDVIQVGKQAEKDSILFYSEIARYAWDSDSQKSLGFIIQEEKKHLIQLQELGKLIEERDVYY